MRRHLVAALALLAGAGPAWADGFGVNFNLGGSLYGGISPMCPSCGGGGYDYGGYGGYAPSYAGGYAAGVAAYPAYPAYYGYNSSVTYPAYGFDAFHGYSHAAVGAPFVPQYEYPAGTYGPYGPSWTVPAYWYGR